MCSEKAVDPGQVGDFLGIILDTLLGKLTLTEAKFLKLMANLQAVMTRKRRHRARPRRFAASY